MDGKHKVPATVILWFKITQQQPFDQKEVASAFGWKDEVGVLSSTLK
jgi:hypothetical protein